MVRVRILSIFESWGSDFIHRVRVRVQISHILVRIRAWILSSMSGSVSGFYQYPNFRHWNEKCHNQTQKMQIIDLAYWSEVTNFHCTDQKCHSFANTVHIQSCIVAIESYNLVNFAEEIKLHSNSKAYCLCELKVDEFSQLLWQKASLNKTS